MEKSKALIETGLRIRNRRKELGMSQQDLANLMGYKSRSTINKIELGKNDMVQSTIKNLAIALKCKPASLIFPGDEENPTAESSEVHYTEKQLEAIDLILKMTDSQLDAFILLGHEVVQQN